MILKKTISDKFTWCVTLSKTEIKPGLFVYTESISPSLEEDDPNESTTIISILLPYSEREKRIEMLLERGFRNEKEDKEKEKKT